MTETEATIWQLFNAGSITYGEAQDRITGKVD